MLIFDNGVVQHSGITEGNVHDINYLKFLNKVPEGKQFLGDRACLSKPLQMDLFDKLSVKLRVPFRMNQHDYNVNPTLDKSFKWKKIGSEQTCSEFSIAQHVCN